MTEMDILLANAELVADVILARVSPISDDLSARDAYKAYGRTWVQDAVKKHKIVPYYVGNRTIYSRKELSALRAIEREHPRVIWREPRKRAQQ